MSLFLSIDTGELIPRMATEYIPTRNARIAEGSETVRKRRADYTKAQTGKGTARLAYGCSRQMLIRRISFVRIPACFRLKPARRHKEPRPLSL
jgi:hypothetical protein